MSERVIVHHGDNREVLKSIPDASVDAVVTDPPYGLSDKTPDAKVVAEVLSAWLAGEEIEVGGTGFMGRAWDAFVPGPAVWRECYRVLKPGGHLVAFFGTRTYDLGALAIRLAGFECRDLLAWLYGNGFPKSLDVGKALDKRRDDRDEIVQVTAYLAGWAQRAGRSRSQIDAHMGTSDMAGWWTSRLAHRCQCPTWDQWLQLKAFLGCDDAMDEAVARLNGRKGQAGEAWEGREFYDAPTGGLHGGTGLTVGAFGVGRQAKPGGVTGAARQWEGWGTALKPGLEPVFFGRKPLVGTVAENVLRHGVGGLNIDACRLEGAKTPAPPGAYRGSDVGAIGLRGFRDGSADHLGRWPGNVLLDGSAEVEALFPRDGAGSVARFFYCAKADASDRPGSDHPTVKPLELMAWLVRLLTPPGGVVLDPFAGTGSTGLAARREGFRAILIEREAKHVEDIRLRLAHAAGAAPHSAALKGRNRKPAAPTDLFGEDA